MENGKFPNIFTVSDFRPESLQLRENKCSKAYALLSQAARPQCRDRKALMSVFRLKQALLVFTEYLHIVHMETIFYCYYVSRL